MSEINFNSEEYSSDSSFTEINDNDETCFSDDEISPPGIIFEDERNGNNCDIQTTNEENDALISQLANTNCTCSFNEKCYEKIPLQRLLQLMQSMR